MKVFFRILFLLASISILIYAAIPPADRDAASDVSETEIPEPSDEQTSDPNLVRDFLGGAQLDAGKKAQDILNEVTESREEDLEELE